MKKHFLKLLQAKWIATLMVFIFVVVFALMLSVHQTGELHHMLFKVDDWVQSQQTLFLLWHILIISAIYYGWGVKVDNAAKRSNLTKDAVNRLKRFRYLMIFFVFVMGLLAGLYRI